MVKKAVQRGRSKRGGEAYSVSVRRVSKRRENKAGGLFQHPARLVRIALAEFDRWCLPLTDLGVEHLNKD